MNFLLERISLRAGTLLWSRHYGCNSNRRTPRSSTVAHSRQTSGVTAFRNKILNKRWFRERPYEAMERSALADTEFAAHQRAGRGDLQNGQPDFSSRNARNTTSYFCKTKPDVTNVIDALRAATTSEKADADLARPSHGNLIEEGRKPG